MSRVSPHIPAADEYLVLDFRDAPFGLAVHRTPHWYTSRGWKIPKQRQIGIMTDRKFFQDSKGRIICWPVIAWEGGVVESMTHPLNVAPFRKKQALRAVTMDDGQWGTNGPE